MWFLLLSQQNAPDLFLNLFLREGFLLSKSNRGLHAFVESPTIKWNAKRCKQVGSRWNGFPPKVTHVPCAGCMRPSTCLVSSVQNLERNFCRSFFMGKISIFMNEYFCLDGDFSKKVNLFVRPIFILVSYCTSKRGIPLSIK